jgi:hypothetical protein
MSDSQPPDDGPGAQPRESLLHRPIPRQWLALGALVIAQMVLGASCGFLLGGKKPSFELLSVGIVLSQPVLTAFWIAMAPHRFHIRFLWGLLVYTLMFFAVGLGMSQKDPSAAVAVAVIDLMLLVICSAILWLLRRMTRWQIVRLDATQPASDYQAYQFGIKHLIVLTAIVALALGLFRTLLLMGPRSTFPGISHLAESVCEITVVLLPVTIVPWFTLVHLKNAVSAIMRAVILMGVVDVVAFRIFQSISRGPDIVDIFFFVQCGASLSMFATALVLRLCGFRMARVQASGARGV